MAKPLHKYPSPRGHEIYIFCRPFLGHHNYIHVLSEQCLGVQKKFFKKNSNFTLFNPRLPPLWMGGGHEIYNCLSPYPADATYQICLRLAL